MWAIKNNSLLKYFTDRGQDYSALDNNNNNMAVQPSENSDETGAGGQCQVGSTTYQHGEELPIEELPNDSCDSCNRYTIGARQIKPQI